VPRPVAVAAALVALCAAAAFAGAQGDPSLGVSPGEIALPDAQPGQTTHVAGSIQNQGSSDAATFTVKRPPQFGPASGWVAVDAGETFVVPARTRMPLDFAITPPEAVGPGHHLGQLNLCHMSSSTVETCYGIHLNVTVGGEQRRQVTWVGATVDDVQVGHSLLANLTARNDGNVRATAQAHADVTPFGGGSVVAQGNGSLVLDPGQSGDVVIVLGAGLPIGQYLVRVTSTDPAGFDETLDAKVTAEGVAPDGWLRAITVPVRVPAGKPVTIAAWFESTGDVPVASARFSAQVLKDGSVVAQLGSEPVAVPAHAHANLTTVWTPASAGSYRIVGHVEYDGFRTTDSEGVVEVGRASGVSWLLVGIVALLFVAAVVLAVLVLRQRRGRTKSR
jgi:hypothetical protein